MFETKMATDEDVVRFLGMLMAKRAALSDHPYEVLRTTHIRATVL